MSVTFRQRKSIIERDGGTSQIRHYSEERGWHTGGYCDESETCTNLHVHHVGTRRNMRDSTREEVDAPENLITTFSCEHVGVCPDGKIDGGRKYVERKHFVIHPDTETAFKNYDGTPRSFKVMGEIREELIAEGEQYYDNDHDREMAETARERTILAQTKGWHYPSVRGWEREARSWKRMLEEDE